MQVYEDEEAAIGAAAAPAPTPEAPATGARTDANDVPVRNWRFFWRRDNWNRNRNGARDVERGGAAVTNERSGDAVGRADAVEMARWRHFARTRR